MVAQASTLSVQCNRVMRLQVAIHTTDDSRSGIGHTDPVVSLTEGRPGPQRTDKAVMGQFDRFLSGHVRCGPAPPSVCREPNRRVAHRTDSAASSFLSQTRPAAPRPLFTAPSRPVPPIKGLFGNVGGWSACEARARGGR